MLTVKGLFTYLLQIIQTNLLSEFQVIDNDPVALSITSPPHLGQVIQIVLTYALPLTIALLLQ